MRFAPLDRSGISIGLLAAVVSGMEPPGTVASTDTESLGKAAVVAYATNQSQFSYYTCRYRCTKGQSRSADEAVRGKFMNGQFYDNRLIVDGSKDLYEGLAPPPDLKRGQPIPGKKGLFKVPVVGELGSYLNDGKREMDYAPPLQSINLFSAEKSFRGIIAPTPLGMGFVGHRNVNGPDVMLKQRDKYEYSAIGLEEVDGRPVVTVRFDEKEIVRLREGPLAIAHTFSFDPSRGHLPIRMTTWWNNKPMKQVFMTHARECSDKRWFPERTVVVHIPNEPTSPCDVLEILLLELDANKRPKNDEFVFTIPAGTSVQEFTDEKNTFFRLRQDERIHVDDLPKLFSMLEDVKSKPTMDTAIAGTRQPGWLQWSGLMGGLMLAGTGAVFLVRRRMRMS